MAICDDIVLQLIPTGKENAITCREICNLTQASRQAITSSISRLRRNGVIICASVYSGGYYMPKDAAELQEWLRIERARIRTHREAIKPAQEYLKANFSNIGKVKADK